MGEIRRGMTEDTHYPSYPVSLRKQVFNLLDKDPLLTPLNLADLLKISFRKSEQTLANYKQDWKHTHENERGSKCCGFHCVRWGLWEPVVSPDRNVALSVGWVQSKAKNRFLIFKNVLGRVVWFETGTVRLHVRAPGTEGKAKQLFSDAFFRTGLIFDVNYFNKCIESFFLDSFHTVVRTDQRLPYVHIRDFKDTNGFEFKSGDRSHPESYEFIIHYQNQFEEAKRGFFDVLKTLEGFTGKNGLGVPQSPKPLGKEDYVS